MPKGPVTIVGAYCVGLVFKGARLPGPGETVIGIIESIPGRTDVERFLANRGSPP